MDIFNRVVFKKAHLDLTEKIYRKWLNTWPGLETAEKKTGEDGGTEGKRLTAGKQNL